MNYHAVVDRFAMPVPLDPLWATLFVATFAGVALLTARRPAYGLCALIAAIPFDVSRELFATTIGLAKIVLLGVVVGLCVFPVLGKLREPPMPWMLVLLAIYVAAVGLSIVHAEHRAPVLRETLKYVEYALVFIVAFLCRRLDSDDEAIVATIAGVTVAVCLTALVQEGIGAPSGLHAGSALVPRIAGVLDGPNQLAGYLSTAVAALAAWTIVRRRSLTDVALTVAACTGMLTFSRGWLIDVAAIITILLLVAGKSARDALRPFFAGLIAGAFGVIAWAVGTHSVDVLRFSAAPTDYAGGVGNRGDLWNAALRMWRQHPIAGVGAGNYELLLPQYGVLGVRTHANSWYLSSLSEGGIVLFAATLALVAGSIATFVRGLRRAGIAPWALGALAATCALAVHQIADYLVFYPKVGGSWWLLVGLGVAGLAAHDRG